MDSAHAALFDELSKIAEEQAKKSTWKNVARTVGAGVLGAGTGLATAQGLMSIPRVREFMTRPSQTKATIAKVILPIMGGAALMLADRYRKHMDEGLHGKPANQKKP
jgi:hypothetical protein